MNVNQFLLQAKFMQVIAAADIDWEPKYNLAFETIYPMIKGTGVRLEWADPDTTYEEDFLAFNRAVQDKANELERIRGQK